MRGEQRQKNTEAGGGGGWDDGGHAQEQAEGAGGDAAGPDPIRRGPASNRAGRIDGTILVPEQTANPASVLKFLYQIIHSIDIAPTIFPLFFRVF